MKALRICILFVSLVLFYGLGVAQTVKYNVSDETTMTVSGTSTLHDWTSRVDTVKGFVEVNEKFSNNGKVKKGAKIPLVSIQVPVISIISPRGATMDKKTYAALKSEENPDIIFELKDSQIVLVNDQSFNVEAQGALTIAGKTNQVSFPVEGKLLGGDKMSFIGAYKLNMKDYDMEPPSAMFGQIVTGEEVEIKFELIVNK